MPRTYDEIKADVNKRMEKMRLAGDFKGMATYYFNSKLENDITKTYLDDYENSTQKLTMNACVEYVRNHSLRTAPEEENNAIAEMLKELLKIRANEGAKLVNGRDKFRQRVENNEVEGVRPINDDPKYVQNFAIGLS